MTADSMEVDPPTGGAAAAADSSGGEGGTAGQGAQEKTLRVHPLALIGISDHHTRVVTGGSALPPTAPVMGLLFGYQDGLTVSILDAEEMEYSFASSSSQSSVSGGGGGFGGGTEEEQAQHRSILRTKIDLHRKVFPTHEVIGWYRVSTNDDGPTEEDLRMNNGTMREYNESPLFVLMNAGGPADEEDRKPSSSSSSTAAAATTAGQEARDKLDRDEQLPLSVYETLVTVATGGDESSSPGGDAAAATAQQQPQQQPRAVFVNLEFELETFEPERIAVEKVFKTRPNVAAAVKAAGSSAGKADAGGGGRSGGDGSGGEASSSASAPSSSADPVAAAVAQAASVQTSGLDVHLQSMHDSIVSMNDRVEILLDFLRRTQSGSIPPDYGLLRQVDGLVRQLPFVMAGFGKDKDGSGGRGGSGGGSSRSRLGKEFENEYDDVLMLSYLAAVAKTVRAVQTYSDKFRLVQDSSNKDFMRRAY